MFSIEESLWPLIVWMKLFGIQMGPIDKKITGLSSNRRRQSVCLLLIGSLMVLSTVGLHCTSFVRGVVRLKANGLGPDGTNLSTANLINIGIEHLNYTCVLVGVHAGFFVVSLTGNWKSLWDAFQLIQENLNFKSSFYHKCRKIVIVGFSLLFLVIYSLIITIPYNYLIKLIDRIASFTSLFRFNRPIGTWAR